MNPDKSCQVRVIDHPDLIPPRDWGDSEPDLDEQVWCLGCRRAWLVRDLDLAWLAYFDEWTPVCRRCGTSSWLNLVEYAEARRLIGPHWPSAPQSGETCEVPPAVESFGATDMRFALDWLDGYREDTGADIAGALEALLGWTAKPLEEQVADLTARGHELEAGQWRNHRTPQSREELRETARMIRKLLDEHETG